MKYIALLPFLASMAAATNHEVPVAPAAAAHTPVVAQQQHELTSTKTVIAVASHPAPAAQKHETVAAAPAHMSAVPAAHAAGARVHTVTVGGLKPVETGMAPALSYFPESIDAAVGDKVKFVFMQKNHTVTQSTFADPCKKMENGMDSGFMPNADGKTGVEWEMDVKTTEPLWFYCKQQAGFHCAKGMVFAINAAKTGEKTFSAWKQLAISKNGTAASLNTAPLASPAPAAAGKPSTVTVNVGGGAASHATQATVAAPHATVAQGHGVTGNGDACSCQCLCGQNSFPQVAAQNHFGGFAGMIS